MAVSNVALTNTFDQWRLVTNQLAVIANDILDDGRQTYRNLIANVATSNTIIANTITVSGMNVQPILNSAFLQANAAFDKANTANVIAVAAFGQANISTIAFSQANTANVVAVAAFGQANAGYNQANTANVVAVAAFGQANAGYNQANTANVVAVAAFNAANTGTPAGVIMPYAGSSEPSGWLFCSGNAVSRTTYSGLFNVLGITYGAGDGSTTFNLPDLRGRSIFGRDDMSGTSANRINSHSSMTGTTLGNTGGTQTHTLTISEIPSHTHTIPQVGGFNDMASAQPGFTVQYNQTTQSTGSTGGGERHQNMPPAMILNFIIKT